VLLRRKGAETPGRGCHGTVGGAAADGRSRRGIVAGYPRTPVRSSSVSVTGPRSTYEQLGFTRDRKIGKHWWVVTTAVMPEGS